MNTQPPSTPRLRHALSQSGWCQFSFLKIEDHAVYSSVLVPGDRLIVITHSCDLLNDSADEPFVECMITKPERELPPQATALANPRQFGFLAYHKPTKKEQAFTVRAATRCSIPKEAFSNLAPDKEWTVHLPHEPEGSSEEAQRFARWLARRYDRVALPDELVRRIKVTGQMKLHFKKMFESGLRELRAVVVPNAELSPLETMAYQLMLFAYLREGVKEDDRKAILNELDKLAQAMRNPLVDVSHISIKGIEETRYVEIEKTQPLDLFTHQTLPTVNEGVSPTATVTEPPIAVATARPA